MVTGKSAAAALVERDAELAVLDRAVTAAVAGDGSLVVVEGPAGIGKSRLLQANRAQARAAGMTVLTARGGELERDFAFGVVRQLFERELLQADAARRDALLAGAAANAAPAVGVPAGVAAHARAQDPSFGVMHGVYWLTANLASAGPLLVQIDDAHWADAATLRSLLYVANRLDGLPLLLVAAARPSEPGAEHELVTQLASVPGAVVVRPGPLSERGSGAVVEGDLGEHADPAFLAACHRSSAGNPIPAPRAHHGAARRRDPAHRRRRGTRPGAASAERVARGAPADRAAS